MDLDPAKYTNRQRKRRLDKARSVSPSLTAGGGGGAGCGSPPTSRRGAVVRQSSVPSRFDEAYVPPNTELEMRYEIRMIEVNFWAERYWSQKCIPDYNIRSDRLFGQFYLAKIVDLITWCHCGILTFFSMDMCEQ